MTRSLILILFSLLCIFFARQREAATQVKPRSTTGFSAENVMDYLTVIAAETHPIGSTANKKVKDYLVAELTKLGLTTSVESGYVDLSWGKSYGRSAYVENVIATLAGSDPAGQKVVLAAHYDSVFEGPGAADDGYAVAAMIETVKLLKDQPRKNDIKLIITDGEEMGLLGAYYHVEKNDMEDVGILLNYEARGNQGPCNAFEWSDDNAWLVREMKKSAIRPITSSLSYEIYKMMPNSSDFTAFARRNVSGINHAFIDGFSYYHNPADNIENISMNSVQHTGENMYLMTKHFSNYDFSVKESGNASFFNFYGLLITYPASRDLLILIFLGLIFLVVIVLAKRDESFKVLGLAKALLWMLLTIILIGVANYGMGLLTKQLYPQYSTFYSYQYYNHEWYFVAGLGLALVLLASMSRWIIPEQGKVGQGVALLLLMSLLAVGIYTVMPTGVYVMSWPAVGLGLAILAKLITKERGKSKLIIGLVYMFFLVGMWTFLSHGLFLAFSLSALPGAVFPASLAALASMYLLPAAWDKTGRKIIFALGLVFCLGSLLVAHIKTKPSEAEPLLTNLKYVYDGETDKSYLATFDYYLHDGHLNLLEGAKQERLPKHLTYSSFYLERESTASQLRSSIVPDSTAQNNNFSYTIANPKRASIAYVYLPKSANVDSVFLDNRYSKKLSASNNELKELTLYGYGLDSLQLRITKLDTNLPAKLYVNMEYQGLAENLDKLEGIAWNDPISYVSNVINIK